MKTPIRSSKLSTRDTFVGHASSHRSSGKDAMRRQAKRAERTDVRYQIAAAIHDHMTNMSVIQSLDDSNVTHSVTPPVEPDQSTGPLAYSSAGRIATDHILYPHDTPCLTKKSAIQQARARKRSTYPRRTSTIRQGIFRVPQQVAL